MKKGINIIAGNEKDCICAKIGGNHAKWCDKYRLREFLIKAAAIKNKKK